jgi:hypothetical protein
VAGRFLYRDGKKEDFPHSVNTTLFLHIPVLKMNASGSIFKFFQKLRIRFMALRVNAGYFYQRTKQKDSDDSPIHNDHS